MCRAYLIRSVAGRSHVRKLQVFQTMCFRIGTKVSWYVTNNKKNDNLRITFFVGHIRVLIVSFD
jgi:hypothetical protein